MTTRQDIELSNTVFKEYQSQSTGTDDYHRISNFHKDLIGTDGVILMANDLKAFWFLDVVASYFSQLKKRYQADDSDSFFVCRLSKLEDDKAIFTIDDGNEGEPFIKQEIPYTDCTLNIRTYLQLGSLDGVNHHWILMMPSEY